MATKMKGHSSSQGFTLLELLLVISLVGVLATLTAWGDRQLPQKWQLRQAGHQVFEDLKVAQAKAEMSGSMTVRNGSLVQQRIFVSFDISSNRYSVFQWQDDNANGVTESGETQLLWQNRLPQGISFSWDPSVARRACSNTNNAPGSPVSFSRPSFLPCDQQPCIKLDNNGFSVMGPGAVYLSDGQQSLAITLTRPGHFTMCEWNGDRWR